MAKAGHKRSTVAELAAARGVTRQAQYKTLKVPGAPAIGKDGKVNAAAAAAFAESRKPLDHNLGDPDIRRATQKAKLYHEQCKAKLSKIELDLKERTVVNREAIFMYIDQVYMTLKQRLVGLPNKMAPRLVGLEAGAIQKALAAEVEELLNSTRAAIAGGM